MKPKTLATGIILAVTGLLCALYLTSCDSIRVRGGFKTDYGTVTYDGENLDLMLRPVRGFSK